MPPRKKTRKKSFPKDAAKDVDATHNSSGTDKKHNGKCSQVNQESESGEVTVNPAKDIIVSNQQLDVIPSKRHKTGDFRSTDSLDYENSDNADEDKEKEGEHMPQHHNYPNPMDVNKNGGNDKVINNYFSSQEENLSPSSGHSARTSHRNVAVDQNITSSTQKPVQQRWNPSESFQQPSDQSNMKHSNSFKRFNASQSCSQQVVPEEYASKHLTNISDVKSTVSQILRSGTKAGPLLRKLFGRFQEEDTRNNRLQEQVCLLLMGYVEDPDLHTTLSTDLMDLLLLGIDLLNCDGLVSICNHIIKALKATPMQRRNMPVQTEATPSSPEHSLLVELQTGRVFEVMPKTLARLEVIDTLAGHEFDTGNAFKSFFLNRLCNLPWPHHCVVPIADALKLVNLTEEQGKFAFAKLIRSLHELPPGEIPALVYQLLLLAQKGHRRLVLEGILSCCVTQSTNLVTMQSSSARQASMQAQGTILMHLSLALKQDQELGKELLKLIRIGTPLSPFTVAATMCLLAAPRYEQAVQTVYKNILKQHEVAMTQLLHAPWLGPYCSISEDPRSMFQAVVRGTVYGWDQITDSLLRLSFFFLDSSSKSDDLQHHIAIDVIIGTFERHLSVRAFVIEEVISRIISRSSPNIEAYLRLFTKLLSDHSDACYKFSERLRDLLDYLVFLPSAQSIAIIEALIPLVKISDRLQDACMLVLRKALFNRALEARLTAIGGYMAILEAFAEDTSLVVEVISSLRRCFSQQLEVRLKLYEDIQVLVEKKPTLAPPFADLIEFQRQQIMQPPSTESEPPFSMAAIVNDKVDMNHQKDSIGALINTMLRLTSVGEVELSNPQFSSALSSFSERLLKCDFEDFELDKDADFSTHDGPKGRNIAAAHVLLEAYDAFVNILCCDALTLEQAQKIVTAIRKRQSIYHEQVRMQLLEIEKGYFHRNFISSMTVSDLLQDGQRKKKDISHRYLVTPETLHGLFTFIFTSHNSDEEGSRAVLTGKVNTVRFLLDAANHGPFKRRDKIIHDEIASMLMPECSSTIESSLLRRLYEEKKHKGYQLRGLCYRLVAKIIQEHAHDTDEEKEVFLQKLLQHVPISPQHNDTDECIAEENDENLGLGENIQTTLVPRQNEMHGWAEQIILNCMKDKEDSKVIPIFVDICELVVSNYSKHGIAEAAKFHAMLYKLCKVGGNIDDANVMKSICQHLMKADNKGEVGYRLIFDCQVFLGCLEDKNAASSPDQLHFQIVSKRACESGLIPSLVLEDCENRLDNIMFGFEHLSRTIKLEKEGHRLSQPQHEFPSEEPLYERLSIVLRTIDVMLQTMFEKKATWNKMFKTTRRVYDTMSFACKMILLSFQTFQEHQIPTVLQDIIHFIAKSLSTHVYTAINFVNEDSELNVKPTAADARLIPNLIYSIEQYEKYVIMIEKKVQLNLLKHMKRSTARDFRISAQAVQQAISNVDTVDIPA